MRANSVERRHRPAMRREERYRQLMGIARQLVAEHGVDALTMMTLADRAGVAKPVVYHHFANSADVVIALLDEHFAEMAQAVLARIEGAETLDEYIARMVDASFDFEGASDLPVRRITNGFSADERINRAYLRHQEEFIRAWARILRAFGTPDHDVDLAAHAISEMIGKTVHTYAFRPEQREARGTTRKLLMAMITAVAPAAAEPQRRLELPRPAQPPAGAERGTTRIAAG